jgi:hypothetical protein
MLLRLDSFEQTMQLQLQKFVQQLETRDAKRDAALVNELKEMFDECKKNLKAAMVDENKKNKVHLSRPIIPSAPDDLADDLVQAQLEEMLDNSE